MKGLKLASPREDGTRTEIRIGGLTVGKDFLVIAGPCSVESEEQVLFTALRVKKAGANVLRGGAYKPRTSPYAFQGLGRYGLEYLKQAGKAAGMPIITEVMDTRDVFLVSEFADILQIGSRNAQNFPLLVEVGKTRKPILLKRGMYATIEEWLNCAEYIMKEGNPNVILCERGIRSIETYTRNTLDLSAVAALKNLTHLPVIVDPSHATGLNALVRPMSLASIFAGCDGLIVEVHPSPKDALSDAEQQLTPDQFDALMRDVNRALAFRQTMDVQYVSDGA
jgi:3-deoxy-7-phosphoheptulonate synthase